MEWRYQQLLGKRVIAADGESVGRVADLVAERRGEELQVTALLVGNASLLRRIAFRRLALFRVAPPRKVPWSLIAEITDVVRLRVVRTTLEQEGDEVLVGTDDQAALIQEEG